MPRHTDDNSDDSFSDADFFEADGGNHGMLFDPWSAESRARALALAERFFRSLSAAEHRNWCLMTVLREEDWYPYGELPTGAVPNMLRSLSRKWDKPPTTDIPAFFFADLIVRPNPFNDGGPPGILVHTHAPTKIRTDDEKTKAAVRDNFKERARGGIDIQFKSFMKSKGGVLGFFDRVYFAKDWQNPMKPDPRDRRRKLPCNDRFTTAMRDYIEATGLRPDDLVMLKNLKRFGTVIRLVSKPIRKS